MYFVPDSVPQQENPHTVKPVLEAGVCPYVHVGMLGKLFSLSALSFYICKMEAKIPRCGLK